MSRCSHVLHTSPHLPPPQEDAMDTVTRIASGMHLCAPQHVLCMDLVHERWDPQLVSELLASMQAQGTYRIDLQTKSFDEVWGVWGVGEVCVRFEGR